MRTSFICGRSDIFGFITTHCIGRRTRGIESDRALNHCLYGIYKIQGKSSSPIPLRKKRIVVAPTPPPIKSYPRRAILIVPLIECCLPIAIHAIAWYRVLSLANTAQIHRKPNQYMNETRPSSPHPCVYSTKPLLLLSLGFGLLLSRIRPLRRALSSLAPQTTTILLDPLMEGLVPILILIRTAISRALRSVERALALLEAGGRGLAGICAALSASVAKL